MCLSTGCACLQVLLGAALQGGLPPALAELDATPLAPGGHTASGALLSAGVQVPAQRAMLLLVLLNFRMLIMSDNDDNRFIR